MRRVNADALTKALGKWIEAHYTDTFTGADAGSEFAYMIGCAAIDTDPTVSAHWIEHRANNGNMHYICSRCGKEVSYPYAKRGGSIA